MISFTEITDECLETNVDVLYSFLHPLEECDVGDMPIHPKIVRFEYYRKFSHTLVVKRSDEGKTEPSRSADTEPISYASVFQLDHSSHAGRTQKL